MPSLKEKVLQTWTNARGWRTRRRLLVFESDDWGAIRMRDPKALRDMELGGLDVGRPVFGRIDCLENRSDLQNLFNVIDRYRDRQNSAPIFTFNTVLGNPDFAAIKADHFERYSHEGLFQSYERYHGDDLRPVWDAAMRASLIQPQFHAREHLNVGLWMNDLRNGLAETRLAFDFDYYGLGTKTSSMRQRNYLAAYWPESPEHLREIQGIVLDGLTKFEELFGFATRTFIACNLVLPRELESALASKGVKLIQGERGQITPSSSGEISIRRSFTGQRNALGQLYSVRNVKFEPFEDPSRDWVASALEEIGASFSWGKPAIISTHRVNYVSGMDANNRDQNLRLLDQLLQSILAKWPDVEFISSDQLLTELKY